MVDRKNFMIQMAAIQELFGGKSSQCVMELYWQSLKILTEEQWKRACEIVIQTHRYNRMPLPAVFLDAVGYSVENRAQNAVSRLKIACRRIGAWSSVSFKDQVLHGVVDGYRYVRGNTKTG